jgi:hypothetical protein
MPPSRWKPRAHPPRRDDIIHHGQRLRDRAHDAHVPAHALRRCVPLLLILRQHALVGLHLHPHRDPQPVAHDLAEQVGRAAAPHSIFDARALAERRDTHVVAMDDDVRERSERGHDVTLELVFSLC